MKNKSKLGKRALVSIRKYFEQVETIADATDDLIITVNESDVRNGVPLDHIQCPGARSAKRCGKADAAIIGKRTAYLIYETKAIRYRVPESLTREEIAVDRGGSFHADQYTLKAPRKGERLLDMRNGKKHGSTFRRNRITVGVRTNIS